jgi:hypothetical protein
MLDDLLTADSTTVTADTTLFTADNDIVLGLIEIVYPVNATVSRNLRMFGNIAAERLDFNRRMYRAPYGGSWAQEGDGRVGPQLVRATAEIWDDRGITYAQTALRVNRGYCETATQVRSVWGTYPVAALQQYAYQPIEAGYRLDIVFISTSGRS